MKGNSKLLMSQSKRLFKPLTGPTVYEGFVGPITRSPMPEDNKTESAAISETAVSDWDKKRHEKVFKKLKAKGENEEMKIKDSFNENGVKVKKLHVEIAPVVVITDGEDDIPMLTSEILEISGAATVADMMDQFKQFTAPAVTENKKKTRKSKKDKHGALNELDCFLFKDKIKKLLDVKTSPVLNAPDEDEFPPIGGIVKKLAVKTKESIFFKKPVKPKKFKFSRDIVPKIPCPRKTSARNDNLLDRDLKDDNVDRQIDFYIDGQSSMFRRNFIEKIPKIEQIDDIDVIVSQIEDTERESMFLNIDNQLSLNKALDEHKLQMNTLREEVIEKFNAPEITAEYKREIKRLNDKFNRDVAILVGLNLFNDVASKVKSGSLADCSNWIKNKLSTYKKKKDEESGADWLYVSPKEEVKDTLVGGKHDMMPIMVLEDIRERNKVPYLLDLEEVFGNIKTTDDLKSNRIDLDTEFDRLILSKVDKNKRFLSSSIAKVQAKMNNILGKFRDLKQGTMSSFKKYISQTFEKSGNNSVITKNYYDLDNEDLIQEQVSSHFSDAELLDFSGKEYERAVRECLPRSPRRRMSFNRDMQLYKNVISGDSQAIMNEIYSNRDKDLDFQCSLRNYMREEHKDADYYSRPFHMSEEKKKEDLEARKAELERADIVMESEYAFLNFDFGLYENCVKSKFAAKQRNRKGDYYEYMLFYNLVI